MITNCGCMRSARLLHCSARWRPEVSIGSCSEGQQRSTPRLLHSKIPAADAARARISGSGHKRSCAHAPQVVVFDRLM
jgi:hypothetical protein